AHRIPGIRRAHAAPPPWLRNRRAALAMLNRTIRRGVSGSTSDFGSDSSASNPGGGAHGYTLAREWRALSDRMAEAHRATGPALQETSDAWLVGRARELMAIVQRSDYREQLHVIEQTDELLGEAQRRGEPVLVAQVLRVGAFARLVTPGHVTEAEPRLDELLAHTRRHGITALRADAHAMRGRKLLVDHQDDAALTEIARSLAILDDGPSPQEQLNDRNRNRLLSAALNACWVVLNQLGVYEAAEEVLARAHHVSR